MPDRTMTEAHTNGLVGDITQILRGRAFHYSIDLWQQEEDEVLMAVLRLLDDTYKRGFEDGIKFIREWRERERTNHD